MLRQRRQQAPDSSSPLVPTPATLSDPTAPADAKASAATKTATTFTSSSRRKMQDEPAAELRTLVGRDSTDSIAGGYRDAPDASPSPTSPSSPSPPLVNTKTTWLQHNQWVALALASGACAAFNGVFAKLYFFLSSHHAHHFLPLVFCHPVNRLLIQSRSSLSSTTTELTTHLSQALARLIGLNAAESVVEVAVRGVRCLITYITFSISRLLNMSSASAFRSLLFFVPSFANMGPSVLSV